MEVVFRWSDGTQICSPCDRGGGNKRWYAEFCDQLNRLCCDGSSRAVVLYKRRRVRRVRRRRVVDADDADDDDDDEEEMRRGGRALHGKF